VGTSEPVYYLMGAASGTLSLTTFSVYPPTFLCLSDICIKPRDIKQFFFPLRYDVRHVLLKLRDRRHWSGQVMMISQTFSIPGPVYYPAPPTSHLLSQPAISSLFLSHTFHLGPHLTFRRESPSSPPRSNSNIHTLFPPTKYTRHHGTPALPRPSEP